MATSDNVVRAGLTPKFKDAETLVKMLTYNQLEEDKEFEVNKGEQRGEGMRLYKSNFSEFDVLLVSKGFSYECTEPSILVITQGKITIENQNHGEVKENQVYLLLPGKTYVSSSQGQDFEGFIALKGGVF